MSNKIIPILFSTAMVQAILDGRKTQTRRVVKQADGWDHNWTPTKDNETYPDGIARYTMRCGSQYSLPVFKCPYGKPGDVLWVRENWKIVGWDFEEPMMRISYQEGGIQNCEVHDPTEDSMWLLNQVEALENGGYIEQDPKDKSRYCFTTKEQPWRPSIHMPKEACRLWLKVKAVRVERLQDISEGDAVEEGVETLGLYPGYSVSAKGKFEGLWNKINGADSWEANPWVWVIEFERCEMPAGFLTRKTAGR